MTPIRIVIASHDPRFFNPIRAHLASLPSVEIRDDPWRGTRPGDHDETYSRELVEWADVIVCEWCQANAVWYSHNKRRGQRLIVRFHRFELENDMPALVDVSAVDLMVFVADHIQRLARERFGWADLRARVIWNAVDTRALDRPKLEFAPTTIGLLGWVPRLKRIDRAIDILEAVRSTDDRFRLLVKGKPPWDHPWIWRRESERWFVADELARVARARRLRNAVVFEPFGEVSDWFRGVGHILSVSDIEGNQVALAEGAASGAVPVVLQRPGASDYPPSWVHADADAAAASILAPGWEERGALAKAFAHEHFAQEPIFANWREILGASERALERGEVRG